MAAGHPPYLLKATFDPAVTGVIAVHIFAFGLPLAWETSVTLRLIEMRSSTTGNFSTALVIEASMQSTTLSQTRSLFWPPH
jgi:hypothetical protein